MSSPSPATIRNFQRTVLAFFKTHGRSFAWRETTDPYRILVSEIMLQQTQTRRVQAYYEQWMARFPTIKALAAAPLRDVLRLWQGLGYNRRAKFLHLLAQEIMRRHDGAIPASFQELKALPGIGPYTAAAVMAFAFNQPIPMIETNIRTVFLHHFFPRKKSVSDKQILSVVEATLWRRNPRQWFYALMDYGAFLKSKTSSVHRHSAHYRPQSKFKGSRRQLRGAVLRELLNRDRCSRALLVKTLGRETADIDEVLHALVAEGLIRRSGRSRIEIV